MALTDSQIIVYYKNTCSVLDTYPALHIRTEQKGNNHDSHHQTNWNPDQGCVGLVDPRSPHSHPVLRLARKPADGHARIQGADPRAVRRLAQDDLRKKRR